MDERAGLLRIYVIAVGVAGLCLIGFGVWISARSMGSLTLALTTAAVLVEAAPARVRQEVEATLITVVIFTGVLLGGTWVAVSITATTALVMALQASNRRWTRLLFNTGQFALAAFVAGVTFVALGGVPGDIAVIVAWEGLAAAGAAALAFTVVNFVLLAIALWLDRGEPLGQTFARLMTMVSFLQVAYMGIAVVAAAILLNVTPVALVLLLIPMLVARYALMGFQEQEQAYGSLVRAFVKAIEVKDGYTRGHAERVAQLSEEVAAELGLGYDDRVLARYGALLHDVGKIGVPLAIINKPGALSDDEFEQIKQHPIIGAEMLRDIDFLTPAIEIVRYHHERVDGFGYPYGVPGDELPALARMVTAVDAFDAMTSTRSYRRAVTVDIALAELYRCAGTQFDPEAVAALDRVVRRLDWQPTIGVEPEVEHAVAGSEHSCAGEAHARHVLSERMVP